MKKYTLILLTTLMIIAVGCANDTTKKDNVGSPFVGGDKGIIAEFLRSGVYSEADKIEEIFDKETFPLEIVFKNKGEANIVAGKAIIKLSGVELSQFEPVMPDRKANAFDLEAVSDSNTQGGEETISIGTFAYKGPLVGNSIDLSFFGKIEYSYKTSISVPQVCLKGDLNDASLCKVDETKQVFSSAAPIQAKTAVEKSAGTGKVSVEIEVQNVGSGKVTLPDTDFDYRFDQLAFEVTPDDKWDCKAGGNAVSARLDSTGKATIVCRLKNALQKSDLFTQALGITLKYQYRDIIHKQLRVKRQG